MSETLVPMERIEKAILLIRGQKVLLDRDLAELYGVETRVLKQAVRRNAERFPEDFMFVLNEEEFENWRSQFVISNEDRMGLRYPPMAFDGVGVCILENVQHYLTGRTQGKPKPTLIVHFRACATECQLQCL